MVPYTVLKPTCPVRVVSTYQVPLRKMPRSVLLSPLKSRAKGRSPATPPNTSELVTRPLKAESRYQVPPR